MLISGFKWNDFPLFNKVSSLFYRRLWNLFVATWLDFRSLQRAKYFTSIFIFLWFCVVDLDFIYKISYNIERKQSWWFVVKIFRNYGSSWNWINENVVKYQIVKKFFMMKTLLGCIYRVFFFIIFINSNLKILKKSMDYKSFNRKMVYLLTM